MMGKLVASRCMSTMVHPVCKLHFQYAIQELRRIGTVVWKLCKRVILEMFCAFVSKDYR